MSSEIAEKKLKALGFYWVQNPYKLKKDLVIERPALDNDEVINFIRFDFETHEVSFNGEMFKTCKDMKDVERFIKFIDFMYYE